VELARCRGFPQRIHVGLPDQKVVVGAEPPGHAERVQGLGVLGILIDPRLRERHRFLDGVREFSLIRGGGIHLAPAQKRVAAADQLSFEGAEAKHLAIQDRHGELVVRRGSARCGGDLLPELDDRRVVLEVVEVLEARGKLWMLRPERHSQEENGSKAREHLRLTF